MNDDFVLCPLVDMEIDIIDCLENTTIREECIPDKFKQKENWQDICKNCKYFDY